MHVKSCCTLICCIAAVLQQLICFSLSVKKSYAPVTVVKKEHKERISMQEKSVQNKLLLCKSMIMHKPVVN